jgi:hypothetical protein
LRAPGSGILGRGELAELVLWEGEAVVDEDGHDATIS